MTPQYTGVTDTALVLMGIPSFGIIVLGLIWFIKIYNRSDKKVESTNEQVDLAHERVIESKNQEILSRDATIDYLRGENKDYLDKLLACNQSHSDLATKVEEMNKNFIAMQSQIKDLKAQIDTIKADIDAVIKGEKKLEDLKSHLV